MIQSLLYLLISNCCKLRGFQFKTTIKVHIRITNQEFFKQIYVEYKVIALDTVSF